MAAERKFRAKLMAAVACLLLFVCIAAWYFRGPFPEQVRHRLSAELETATGGAVEIAQFHWKPARLQFDVTDLTIHGLEPAGDLPYVHVDHLHAQMTILSLFRRRIAMRELLIERPRVHIIVFPDGHTNQPQPRANNGPATRLAEFSIQKLLIRDGWLMCNERRLPLNLFANDVSVGITYFPGERRYETSLRAGNIDVEREGFQPFSASAEGELSLFPDHADINSLVIHSARLQLSASGSISDWDRPTISALYKITTDLREATAALRLPVTVTGRLEVSGKGVFSRDSLVSNGTATFKQGDWNDGAVHVRNITGGFEYALTPEHISVPHLFVSVLGGSITGHGDVVDWPAFIKSSEPGGQERKNQTPAPRATAAFSLHRLSLAELASAFSVRKVATQDMNAAGVVNGNIAASWRGSITNPQAQVDLQVSPPPALTAGQTPVTAHLQATYRGAPKLLQITDLTASTPATHLEAGGALGSSQTNLRLTLSTSKLAEIMPLLEGLPQVPAKFELGGTASFAGTAAGTLLMPVVAGRLEVHDFTAVVPRGHPGPQEVQPEPNKVPRRALRAFLSSFRPKPPAATAPVTSAPPVRIHWDSLSGNVSISPKLVAIDHVGLRRGNTRVDLEASSSLEKERLVGAAHLHARLQVHDGDVADIQSIAGTRYPVSGTFNATLQVSGTPAGLAGNGHFAVAKAMAYGEPIRAMNADLQFQDRQAELRKVIVESNKGTLTGEGALNASSKEFKFTVYGDNLRLDRVRSLQTRRVQVQGTLGLEAHGSGTFDAPVLNGNARLRNLSINGERLGELTIDAVTQGTELKVTARSNLRNGSLAIDGSLGLQSEMPINATLAAKDLQLEPLLKTVLPAGHENSALLDGEIQVQGAARSPSSLDAQVRISKLAVELETLPVKNAGLIRLHVHDGVLTVDELRLEGEEAHYIEVHGQAELKGEQRLDLQAEGKADLRLLQTLDPNLTARGAAEFAVRTRGTLASPYFGGQVSIANGAVSYVDLPNGLTNINGTLVFSRDRLQVQQLTAMTGGGRLTLGGAVSYTKALVFDLTAEGKDIRLRYPEGVSSTIDARLALSGSTAGALLSGNVTVNRLALNQQFDFATYFVKRARLVGPANPESPANNLKLDVHVASPSQLQVQTSLARVTGNVDLQVRGTAARPSVRGRISILEGNLTIAGTTYRLDRGDITFINPVSIDPNIDVEASARVRDYDITLGLQGTLSRINLTYHSDPPLSSTDIISLLALGRTREEQIVQPAGTSNAGAQGLNESASNVILSQALNSAVNSRVQKLFGVSRIKIDPVVGGSQSGTNARLTVEQTVSNRVTLTYITNVTQSAQQILQFEYYITPGISIVGVRDQNGVVGFDLFVRRRKR